MGYFNDLLKNAGNWLENTKNNVVTGIGKGINAIGNAAVGIANGARGYVNGLINNGLNYVKGLIGGAVTPTGTGGATGGAGSYSGELVQGGAESGSGGTGDGIITAGNGSDTGGATGSSYLDAIAGVKEYIGKQNEYIDGYYQTLIDLAEKQKADEEAAARRAYGASLIDANAAYQRGLVGYGAKGEAMASMGLTGSGYSDYLAGKNYETYRGEVSDAKVAQAIAMGQAENNYQSALLSAEGKKFEQKLVLGEKEYEYSEAARKEAKADATDAASAVNKALEYAKSGNYTYDEIKAWLDTLGYSYDPSALSQIEAAVNEAAKTSRKSIVNGILDSILSGALGKNTINNYLATYLPDASEPEKELINSFLSEAATENDRAFVRSLLEGEEDISEMSTEEIVAYAKSYGADLGSEVFEAFARATGNEALIKIAESSKGGAITDVDGTGEKEPSNGNKEPNAEPEEEPKTAPSTNHTLLAARLKAADGSYNYTVTELKKFEEEGSLGSGEAASLIDLQHGEVIEDAIADIENGASITDIAQDLATLATKDIIDGTFDMKEIWDAFAKRASEKYSAPRKAGDNGTNLHDAVAEMTELKKLGYNDTSAYDALTTSVSVVDGVPESRRGRESEKLFLAGTTDKGTKVNYRGSEAWLDLSEPKNFSEADRAELERIYGGKPTNTPAAVVAYGDLYVYTDSGWKIAYSNWEKESGVLKDIVKELTT